MTSSAEVTDEVDGERRPPKRANDLVEAVSALSLTDRLRFLYYLAENKPAPVRAALREFRASRLGPWSTPE